MMDETALPPLRPTKGYESGFALDYAIQLRSLALPGMRILATTGQFCDALALVFTLHDTVAWWIEHADCGYIEQLHLVLQRECRAWLALRQRARTERGYAKAPSPASSEEGKATEQEQFHLEGHQSP